MEKLIFLRNPVKFLDFLSSTYKLDAVSTGEYIPWTKEYCKFVFAFHNCFSTFQQSVDVKSKKQKHRNNSLKFV